MANDSSVTLEEALAFIDFCEDESALKGSSPTGSLDDLLLFEHIDDLLNSAPPPLKKKRVRKASSSSTALQRRRKAEMEALRQEAIQLEGYLAQLKRQNGRSSGLEHPTAALELVKHDDPSQNWHSRATTELQERLQAEQKNLRLNEVRDSQQKLRSQLLRILRHENTHYGYDFVRKLASPVRQDSYIKEAKSPTAMASEFISLDNVDRLLVSLFPTLSPTELSPTKTKKRPRSSTAAQRCQKAEIEALRTELAHLGAISARLRRAGGQSTSVDGQVSEWHRKALAQYEERHRSEQMYWRLKEILEKRRRCPTCYEGLDFVRIFESPYFEDRHFTLDQSSLLLQQLEHEVESTYRDFNQVYRPQDDPTVCATPPIVYNETCELNVMEFVTSTPLNWPLEAAFNHIWGYLQSSSNRSLKLDTVATKIDLLLPVQGSGLHFHKFHFLRKFEEKDRIIVIWSDLLQMTSKNLRLRSLAHAVLTRSETNPDRACVMDTNLKLYLDLPPSEQKLSPEDIRHAQDVVLRGMGRLMRQFWQNDQNGLLELTST
ncbi:hypothetical protein PF008_g26545 [Phytophthora fragariae]|uniref:Uncharacterized protein n=1 Tax=Phytophthora fragariae TaxID=53985 RepID=A0A6G0QGR8_9STRA|nr:hypothetical protein PF008_g26545 [Phytophthora fragariae]